MQRLSLAELKAQKNNVVANLEAIKGGNLDNCHTRITVINNASGTSMSVEVVIIK